MSILLSCFRSFQGPRLKYQLLKVCKGHPLPQVSAPVAAWHRPPVLLLQPRCLTCRPQRTSSSPSPSPFCLCRTCFALSDALSPSLQPCYLSACSGLFAQLCPPGTASVSCQRQVPCGQRLPTDGWPRACSLWNEARRPGAVTVMVQGGPAG